MGPLKKCTKSDADKDLIYLLCVKGLIKSIFKNTQNISLQKMSGPRRESSERRKYNQPRNIGNIHKPQRRSRKCRLGQEVHFAYQITKDLNNQLSTMAPGSRKTGTIISSSWEGLLNQPSWKAICQYVKRA